MKLTRIQKKLLKAYQRLHTESLSAHAVLRSCAIPWTLLLLGASYGYWLASSGAVAAGWCIVGLCLGAMLRDIGRFQLLFRTWPALHEVISWDRVAELLRASEK